MFEGFKANKKGKENAINKNEAPTLSPRVQALLRIEEQILDKETQENISADRIEEKTLRGVDNENWSKKEKKHEKEYIDERYTKSANRRTDKYTEELNEQTQSLLDVLTPTEMAEYKEASRINDKELANSGFDTFEYKDKVQFGSEEELPLKIKQNLDLFLNNHDKNVEAIENSQKFPRENIRDAQKNLESFDEDTQGRVIKYAEKRVKDAKEFARESFERNKKNLDPANYGKYNWAGNLSGDEEKLLESVIEKKLAELKASEYDTFYALEQGKALSAKNEKMTDDNEKVVEEDRKTEDA